MTTHKENNVNVDSVVQGQTPGPWIAVQCEKAGKPGCPIDIYPTGSWEVRAANGKSVTGWGRVSQSEANARLIASAPDLLAENVRLREALANCVAALQYAQSIIPHGEPLLLKIEATEKAGRAALSGAGK